MLVTDRACARSAPSIGMAHHDVRHKKESDYMNAIKNCLIAALLIASLVQWVRLESLTKSRSDALRQLELNLAKQPTQGDSSVAGKLLLKEHHDFDFYNAQTIDAWMPQTGLGTILLPRDPVRALSKYGISHWAWAIRGDKAKGRKLLAERLGRLDAGTISFKIAEDAKSITRFLITQETEVNPIFPNYNEFSFVLHIND